MQPRIIVTRHRPWFKLMLIGGGGFVLVLAAWGLYLYTRASTVGDFESAQLEVVQLREERRTLTRDLRAAREEIRRLKEQAVYIERSREIDEQASNAVRESLAQLQTEASDLREQLAFYRGIVAPEQSRAGVRVYEFKLSPGGESRRYAYDLVLIQSVRHDKRVGGRIELELVGTRNGTEARIPWSKLQAGEVAQDLLFSLRYFEEFSGEILVPRDFTPTRVLVSLVPQGTGSPRVEESFDWNRLVGGGGG